MAVRIKNSNPKGIEISVTIPIRSINTGMLIIAKRPDRMAIVILVVFMFTKLSFFALNLAYVKTLASKTTIQHKKLTMIPISVILYVNEREPI